MDADRTEPDVAEPQEVVQYLTSIMRSTREVKQSDRVHAAAGLTNYFLAGEIAGLITLLTQPPEFFQPEPDPTE